MDDAKLMKVRDGCQLNWPAALGGGMRGGPGYIVWSDDPVCVGQERKLEDAPSGVKATPVLGPGGMKWLLKQGFRRLDSDFGEMPEPPKPAPAPKKKFGKKADAEDED